MFWHGVFGEMKLTYKTLKGTSVEPPWKPQNLRGTSVEPPWDVRGRPFGCQIQVFNVFHIIL